MTTPPPAPITVHNAIFWNRGMPESGPHSWGEFVKGHATAGLGAAIQTIVAQSILGVGQVLGQVVALIVFGGPSKGESKETKMLHTALKIDILAGKCGDFVGKDGEVRKEVVEAIASEKDPQTRLLLLGGVATCVKKCS